MAPKHNLNNVIAKWRIMRAFIRAGHYCKRAASVCRRLIPHSFIHSFVHSFIHLFSCQMALWLWLRLSLALPNAAAIYLSRYLSVSRTKCQSRLHSTPLHSTPLIANDTIDNDGILRSPVIERTAVARRQLPVAIHWSQQVTQSQSVCHSPRTRQACQSH